MLFIKDEHIVDSLSFWVTPGFSRHFGAWECHNHLRSGGFTCRLSHPRKEEEALLSRSIRVAPEVLLEAWVFFFSGGPWEKGHQPSHNFSISFFWGHESSLGCRFGFYEVLKRHAKNYTKQTALYYEGLRTHWHAFASAGRFLSDLGRDRSMAKKGTKVEFELMDV